MKIPSHCALERRDPKIVLEERLSKIVFLNASRKVIEQIRVDGCVIADGLRCDYLLINETDVEHYVELKGIDVDHAIAQIKRTVQQISRNPYQQPKICFIISSRCPLLTTKIQELKLLFKKQYNSSLIIKNRYCEHKL